MTKKKAINLEPADVFVNMPHKEVEWIWQTQAARGCVTLLVAPPKAGKSLFIKNLLNAISSGSEFLGLPTNGAAVAYLALEEHPSFLKDDLKKLKIDSGSVHIHCGGLLSNNVEDALIEIAEYCRDYNIGFVAIDPLAKFFHLKDTNDYMEVYRKLSKLTDLARAENIHIMVVHHSNKGGSDSANQILGSTGIFGVSDGAFIIARSKDVVTFKSNLRYGKSIDSCQFTYEDSKIKYLGEGESIRLNQISHDVFRVINDLEPISFNDLQDHLNVRRESLFAVLGQLEASGAILKSGKGVKGSEFNYSIPKLESQKVELNG